MCRTEMLYSSVYLYITSSMEHRHLMLTLTQRWILYIRDEKDSRSISKFIPPRDKHVSNNITTYIYFAESRRCVMDRFSILLGKRILCGAVFGMYRISKTKRKNTHTYESGMNTELSRLQGKRITFVSEIENKDFPDAGVIKSGSDPISPEDAEKALLALLGLPINHKQVFKHDRSMHFLQPVWNEGEAKQEISRCFRNTPIDEEKRNDFIKKSRLASAYVFPDKEPVIVNIRDLYPSVSTYKPLFSKSPNEIPSALPFSNYNTFLQTTEEVERESELRKKLNRDVLESLPPGVTYGDTDKEDAPNNPLIHFPYLSKSTEYKLIDFKMNSYALNPYCLKFLHSSPTPEVPQNYSLEFMKDGFEDKHEDLKEDEQEVEADKIESNTQKMTNKLPFGRRPSNMSVKDLYEKLCSHSDKVNEESKST